MTAPALTPCEVKPVPTWQEEYIRLRKAGDQREDMPLKAFCMRTEIDALRRIMEGRNG